MSPLVALSLFIYVIYLIVISLRKKQKQNKSRNVSSVTSVGSFDVNKHIESVVAQAKAIGNDIQDNMTINRLESKSDDWLAKQIAYEHSIKREIDDMFMLKREHENHCDAFDLKMEHYSTCDANYNREVYQGTDKMSQSEMNDLKEHIRQRRA